MINERLFCIKKKTIHVFRIQYTTQESISLGFRYCFRRFHTKKSVTFLQLTKKKKQGQLATTINNIMYTFFGKKYVYAVHM